MGKGGILCPVCGKFEFEDFEDLENCSVCGWKINIRQYDDHDFSDSTNALSVNEYKIEYEAMTNEKIAKEAEALKKDFYDRRFSMYREFREVTRAMGTQSCEDMSRKQHEQRLEYMEQLHALISSAK